MKITKTMINRAFLHRKRHKKVGEDIEKIGRRNRWYFHNRQDPCKLVWELGQKYYDLMQDKKKRPRRRVKNPAALVKLLYWYWLTGAREREAFIKPYPKLSIINIENETRAIIEHINEKHWKDGQREVVRAAIPIFDEWEQSMWNFITDGGQETQAEKIFQYETWKSTEQSLITKLFKYAFKTTLVDPKNGNVYRNEGISPHILRHMRSYNVLFNHGMYKRGREIIKLWFGWDDDYMLDYYAHIKELMVISDQESILRKENLLTNFKIDASKYLFTAPSIR